MKIFINFIFFLTIIFAISTFVSAQEKIVISTNPPPAYVPLPVLKEVGQAKVTYNERKNEVVAQTTSLQVFGKFLDGIRIQARFATQGKKVVKPEKITLGISAAAKDRTYVDDRSIKILMSEREIVNGTTKFDKAVSDGRVIIASLEQELSYDLFVKITKSKKIKMQIGRTEFELKESDIEAFRDLLRLIEK
ncbi:MAG: hypothetical protein LH472_01640 [Pyrinomonadaceae bacterium]|nr:hypothetical protein [Pyrinomonadaceae bacterium]